MIGIDATLRSLNLHSLHLLSHLFLLPVASPGLLFADIFLFSTAWKSGEK